MTTKTKLITKAQVQAELRRIKRENPDAVNPTATSKSGFVTCLYHKGRGRNIRRCIIGQMGYDMGLPTPRPQAGGIEDVATYNGPWADLFTAGAISYMDEIQSQADGSPGKDPIPWGQVKL